METSRRSRGVTKSSSVHAVQATGCRDFSTKKSISFDQDIFKHIGVQPSAQKILVLKSTCHFRADFQPIAEAILIAVAPGAHLVDSTQYPFRHLRPGVRLSPMGPEFRPGKE